MKKNILCLVVILICLNSLCVKGSNFFYDNKENETSDIPELKLVWEENFNKPNLDNDIWNIELVKKPHNQELQEYKSENISIGKEPISGNDCLIITAKREDTDGRFFSSGRLNTLNKLSFRYGRIDASIKLPKTSNGLWPAFWMMGVDRNILGWPMCGEIDILEMGHANGIKSNSQEKYLGVACHWGKNTKSHKSIGKKSDFLYSLQDDEFHLYSIIWDENTIAFYVDIDKNKEPFYIFNYGNNKEEASKYFRKEFSILLNLAVGGNYTGIIGNSNIDNITALSSENDYQSKMYIDYIRIYQRGISNERLSISSKK